MKTIQDYPFFADIPAKTYHEEARAGKYLSSHLLGDFRHCPRLYRQKMTGEVTEEEYEVKDVDYNVWLKRGAPPEAPHTVRVTCRLDLLHSISEWLCPEHTGYARRKFEKWWREHALPDCPMPVTAEDVCEFAFMGMLRRVEKIKVRTVSGEKYPNVIGYELGDAPANDAAAESVDADDVDDIPF